MPIKQTALGAVQFNELLQPIPEKQLTAQGIPDTFQYVIDRELFEKILATPWGTNRIAVLLREMPARNMALLVDASMRQEETTPEFTWERICFVNCDLAGDYSGIFKHCSFLSSYFHEAVFHTGGFQDCLFLNSDFKNTEFDVCAFIDPQWEDSSFENVAWSHYSVNNAVVRGCSFARCRLRNGGFHRSNKLTKNEFVEVAFDNTRFEGTHWQRNRLCTCEFTTGNWERFQFEDSDVSTTHFSQLLLADGVFKGVRDSGGNAFDDVSLKNVTGLRLPAASSYQPEPSKMTF